MPRKASSGISLMEIAFLILLVGVLLAPLLDRRAATLRAGTSIKLATANLIYINNLMESATASGQINTVDNNGLPVDIDLESIQPGQSVTTRLATAKDNAFWYRWVVRDVSYRLDANGNLERRNNSPILVAPKGTRVYSAALQVYNQNPGNSNVAPDDIFMTTMRTNTGVDQLTSKVGVDFLFDNSESMGATIMDNSHNGDLNYQMDAAVSYAFPGDSNWNELIIDPSIPNHSGATVDLSSRTAHYNTSLSGEVNRYYVRDLNNGIRCTRLNFPHLTYRYRYLTGNQNFPQAYGLSNAEQLNPFDNSQLDLTFQKNYANSTPNRTYPAPGVLGLPATGAPGALDGPPGKWNIPQTSKFIRIFDVIAASSNQWGGGCTGEGVCGCRRFADWMLNPYHKTLPMPGGFRFNTNTGLYEGYNTSYTNPYAPPFNIYNNAGVGNICMYLPGEPPYGQDLRRHYTEIANKNTNDADFDTFINQHLIRMEMARNSILKFLVSLEQYDDIVDRGLLGFQMFNHTLNDSISLAQGGATNQYVSLHPDRPKLFEKLRLILLRIERYGAPDGCLIPEHSQTPMYDRLYDAAQEMKSDPTLTDRFVIMFTDGIPTDADGHEDPSLPPAIRNMVRNEFNDNGSEITLFNVGIIGSNANQLRDWSSQTQGGATFYAGDQNQLDASFAQIVVLIQRRVLLNQINRYNLDLV